MDEPRVDTLDQISTVLFVLSEIAAGDYAARVDVEGWDGTPLASLARGVNELAAILAAARQDGLEYRDQLEDKIRIVEAQRAAIDELSCPVIELWDQVLCVPIVGLMDASRGTHITEALLRRVVDKKAGYAIVDVTGIGAMDTTTVDHFLRLVRSVRLLGADCALSGVHPAVAQTIIHMGIDLGGIRTFPTLRTALEEWVRNGRDRRHTHTGWHITSRE